MQLLAAMGRRLRTTVERLRHTASRNPNEQIPESHRLLHKVIDAIAEFAGSIPFLMIHVVLFTAWLTINSVPIPGIPQFDAYPFGFLTLSVSLEAIFLSVFVLLSQNRQAAKERVRSDIEYDVNLKAELEIAHLHEKLDRLTAESLGRLERIQRNLRSLAETKIEVPNRLPLVLSPQALGRQHIFDLAERERVDHVLPGKPTLAGGTDSEDTIILQTKRPECASGLMAHLTPFSLASGHQRQSISSRRGLALSSMMVPVSAAASITAGAFHPHRALVSAALRPVRWPSMVTCGLAPWP